MRPDRIVRKIVRPVVIGRSGVNGHPIAPKILVVTPVSAKINNEVVLIGQGFGEFEKFVFDAFFRRCSIFDEGDVGFLKIVTALHQPNKNLHIFDGIVKFRAIYVLVNGNGQQVILPLRTGLRGVCLLVKVQSFIFGHEWLVFVIIFDFTQR